MKLPNHNPTQLTAWKELEAHFSAIQDQTILNLFETEKDRLNQLAFTWEDFYVDLSKNRLTQKTIQLLIKLAKEAELPSAIASYFSGEAINETENRAVHFDKQWPN